MNDDIRIYLTKAEESLAGTELEFAAGYYNNCANRSYYAAFQAAVYALARAGVLPIGSLTTWRHRTLQAVFAGELITRRKVFPGAVRSVLEHLYELRQTADYGTISISQVRAARALRQARDFVGQITRMR